MGEYAAGGITGTRSSFGGTMCNAYDTERAAGRVERRLGHGGRGELRDLRDRRGDAARRCANRPKNNNLVGIAPTRELVSADGMIQRGITTRVGPICRTVEDAARILDVYAGFDPKDELTAFSTDRKPPTAVLSRE